MPRKDWRRAPYRPGKPGRNQWGAFTEIQRGAPLTDTEKRCIDLVIEGYAPVQIAAKVDVDPSNVTRQLQSACVKLGATTVPQLAVKYDRTKRDKGEGG
jgi:DNA-binding CsgD family transcriptional regulator